ncbi:hypothetical protein HZ326_13462 [Fusarium oxysporum f. sp. albedinis]|nr:hypothetical protein HZ326_13462 [Fusarium oxysporum f. sp. albedinis]
MLGPQRPTPTRGVHDMAFTGTPRHNSHSIPNPSFPFPSLAFSSFGVFLFRLVLLSYKEAINLFSFSSFLFLS